MLNHLYNYYRDARQNRWFNYFTLFCRVALAAGFIPSGMVKILGERFTSLSNNHPMGHYLEALHHTAYYYTFIGIAQVTAAFLLLIPRTALLGALLYFPIILNICILSLAVRFDGSLLSSPLMVLANFYLLCWDYDKLKPIFPWHRKADVVEPRVLNNQFPIKFFVGSFTAVAILVFIITHAYDIRPHNTLSDCTKDCATSKNPEACDNFCNCIHTKGEPIEKCLEDYNSAIHKVNSTR
jgi:uncharacterized membrane protein YphA (DoxX/SURF4 family)